MSKKSEHKYFNFPIVLLEGFIRNDEVLDNIFDYAIYAHTLKYEYGDYVEMIKSASKYFGVKTGDALKTYRNGEMLYNSIPRKTPKVGLSLDIFWDYYKNDKDEFQKVCLLGFLAIKSILQNKAYCKMTNKFWLSRMDGKTKSVNTYDDLSPEILKYANEYQTKKIKTELIHNWSLEHYSRYTRGFYVSFKLSQEELIYEAEKKRKSTKEKQRKFSEQIALERVLSRLNNQN